MTREGGRCIKIVTTRQENFKLSADTRQGQKLSITCRVAFFLSQMRQGLVSMCGCVFLATRCAFATRQMKTFSFSCRLFLSRPIVLLLTRINVLTNFEVFSVNRLVPTLLNLKFYGFVVWNTLNQSPNGL